MRGGTDYTLFSRYSWIFKNLNEDRINNTRERLSVQFVQVRRVSAIYRLTTQLEKLIFNNSIGRTHS